MSDSEKLEELAVRYGSDVYRFCRYLTSDRECADELYQDTFLKAAQLGGKLADGKNCKSYLFSIAANIWRNQIHKNSRRKAAVSCSDYDGAVEQIPDSSGDISEQYAEKELQNKVRSLVAQLGSKQKAVVVLYYGEDMPIKDISRILRIPQGTVMSRLAKARENIKKKLEEDGYEI